MTPAAASTGSPGVEIDGVLREAWMEQSVAPAPSPISRLTSVPDQSVLLRPRFSEELQHLLVFNCVYQAVGH